MIVMGSVAVMRIGEGFSVESIRGGVMTNVKEAVPELGPESAKLV
jgi:hypothetical protein